MKMHPEEFSDIQYELDLTDRQLSDALGLSEDSGPRMIRRMKVGEVAISGPVANCMFAFQDGYRPDAWPE